MEIIGLSIGFECFFEDCFRARKILCIRQFESKNERTQEHEIQYFIVSAFFLLFMSDFPGNIGFNVESEGSHTNTVPNFEGAGGDLDGGHETEEMEETGDRHIFNGVNYQC